ncbi:MAG TPA: Rieske (2Fe-2S) protein [Bryobacteraceae bacterium]|nr:Rieske (2Fe-2S) protein [Bryobacteraceae bacterium]
MNLDTLLDPRSPERRQLLTRFTLGISALGAAIIAVPFFGFIIGPLLRAVGQTWRPVGALNQFAEGQTVEVSYPDASPLPWAGVTGKTAAWLRRLSGEQFQAFSINCTHLGCPVRWLPDARLFMCPCHGGVYYADGRVAGGPPPRPLEQYQVRVRNGQVEILTSPTPIT